jgi:hypothetical protein
MLNLRMGNVVFQLDLMQISVEVDPRERIVSAPEQDCSILGLTVRGPSVRIIAITQVTQPVDDDIDLHGPMAMIYITVVHRAGFSHSALNQ